MIALKQKYQQKVFLLLPGIILALLSFAIRYKALLQSPFANGRDGYFYLAQIKSWIEAGSLYIEDYSLIYPFLRVNCWFTGDYVLGFKVAAALLAGGATFAMFLLARQWSGSIYLAVLVGSVSLFSPHLTYFTAQHPKNLLGVLFFLLFLYTLSSKQSWKPALLLGLNFFGHKLTLGLSLVFGGLMLVFKKINLKTASFLVFIAFLLLLMSQFLPGLPGINDLERFQSSFSKMPQFSPWSFVAAFGQNGKISSFWLGEIVLASAIYFLSIPFLFRVEKRAVSWSFFVICTLLLFPFLKWSLSGIAYHFFLVFILLSSLFLCLMITRNEARRQKFILLGISILLMVGSIFSFRSYFPEKHDPNVEKYKELVRKSVDFLQEKPVHAIIAHTGLAEYFTYATGIHAIPWVPESVDEKEKLWRIATNIRASELENHLTATDLESVNRLNVKYFLLPEYLWQKVIRAAEAEENTYLLEKINTWRNPYEVRSEYLMKKK